MLLTTIKTILTHKLKSSQKVPSDEILESFLFESLYYIANKCDPKELICSPEDTDEEVMRLIEDGAFIKVPEYPDLTSITAHLMIDEPLTYAAINYTCFLHSSEEIYKALADEIILEFIAQSGRDKYVSV